MVLNSGIEHEARALKQHEARTAIINHAITYPLVGVSSSFK